MHAKAYDNQMKSVLEDQQTYETEYEKEQYWSHFVTERISKARRLGWDVLAINVGWYERGGRRFTRHVAFVTNQESGVNTEDFDAALLFLRLMLYVPEAAHISLAQHDGTNCVRFVWFSDYSAPHQIKREIL